MNLLASNPVKQKHCATCERWNGDAKLRRGGHRAGDVTFEDGISAICAYHNETTPSTANCPNYLISSKAYSLM